MKSGNVLALPDVMLMSHRVLQAWFNEVAQCSRPPRRDADVTQSTASLLEYDN